VTCVEDGRLSKANFYAWLDQALESPEDRELFSLGNRGERSAVEEMPEAKTLAARVVTDLEQPSHDPPD